MRRPCRRCPARHVRSWSRAVQDRSKAGQIANDAVASLSGTVHEVRAHARAPCALNLVGDVVEEQA